MTQNEKNELITKAQQGDAKAQWKLGDAYEYDDISPDGSKNNMECALEWYRKSAAQGYKPGQYALAGCYRLGDGVPKDLNEALKLYIQAGTDDEFGKGLVAAQVDAGDFYGQGDMHNGDKEQGRKEASRWYQKATENDENCPRKANAQYKLAQNLFIEWNDALITKTREYAEAKAELERIYNLAKKAVDSGNIAIHVGNPADKTAYKNNAKEFLAAVEKKLDAKKTLIESTWNCPECQAANSNETEYCRDCNYVRAVSKPPQPTPPPLLPTSPPPPKSPSIITKIIRRIGRIAAFLLAAIAIVLIFKTYIITCSATSGVTGMLIIMAVANFIPFMFVYFPRSLACRIVFLILGILMNWWIFTFTNDYICGTYCDADAEAALIVKVCVFNVASYLTAMIFPRQKC